MQNKTTELLLQQIFSNWTISTIVACLNPKEREDSNNKLIWFAPYIRGMEVNQTESKTHEFPFEFFVNGTQGHGPS